MTFIRIGVVLLACMHMLGHASVERGTSVALQLPEQSASPPAPVQPPMPPVVQPEEPASPTSPVPLGSCDAGGCWSTDAKRYNGGAGGVYLDNRGKPCTRQGPWMHCS